MKRLTEFFRWLLGPAELRALRRATKWAIGTFLVAFTLLQEAGYGPYPGALTALVFAWFGLVVGLVTGLADGRSATGEGLI